MPRSRKALLKQIGISLLTSAILGLTTYTLLTTQFDLANRRAIWISLILTSKLFVTQFFSKNVRCLVCLTIPQILSRRGRAGLIAYAYILVISGPGKNAAKNMDVLSESLTCEQEQLKAAYKKLVQVMKEPFYALKDVIQSILTTIEEAFSKVKKILVEIVGLMRTICEWQI
jgi:hypothetical protein